MLEVKIYPLAHEDLESLRCIRNSDQIKKFLIYQEDISPNQQEAWLKSLPERKERVYLYKTPGEIIGYGQVQEIDESMFELGSVISEPKYQNTPLPYILSSALILKTTEDPRWKKLQTRVRSDNPRAINFNLKQGLHLAQTIELQECSSFHVNIYQIEIKYWKEINSARLNRFSNSIKASLKAISHAIH
jgi:RimJ/RimL family protein N-acetyltransferase